MEAPAVLYHYTSLDTLAMILHNRLSGSAG